MLPLVCGHHGFLGTHPDINIQKPSAAFAPLVPFVCVGLNADPDLWCKATNRLWSALKRWSRNACQRTLEWIAASGLSIRHFLFWWQRRTFLNCWKTSTRTPSSDQLNNETVLSSVALKVLNGPFPCVCIYAHVCDIIQ